MKCPRCDHIVAESDRFCGRCGLGQPKDGVPVDPLVGLVVDDRYRIEKRIGVGGMGTVYVGHHVSLGQAVAIKVLHERHVKNKQLVERFQLEARTYAKVDHPNVVKLLHFDQMPDGTTYMVMEFCPGTSLAEFMRLTDELQPAQAVDLVIQAAQGLSATHAAGIVHRDLKPENIVLTETRRGRYHVKLLDFGIAKVLDDDGPKLTQAGMVFGTPEYMAPEQARGQMVDERSDIYALGCVLYELLTGKPPFTGSDKIQVMHRQATEAPVPPREKGPGKEISAALERVCLCCLEKRPADRYADTDTLIDALEAVRPTGHLVSARALSTAPPTPTGPRPSRTPAPDPTDPQPVVGSAPMVLQRSTTQHPARGLRRGTTPTPAVMPLMQSSPGGLNSDEHFFIDPGPPPGFTGTEGSSVAFIVAALLFVGAVGVGAWFFSAKGKVPDVMPPRQTASAAVEGDHRPSTRPAPIRPATVAAPASMVRPKAPATQPASRPSRPKRPPSEAVASRAPERPTSAAKPRKPAKQPTSVARRPVKPPVRKAPATEAPKPGPTVGEHIESAEQHLLGGRLKPAERAVKAAQALAPKSRAAKALAQRISEVRSAYNRGKRAFKAKNCATALKALEPLKTEAPGLPELDSMIGTCANAMPPREM
jgi:serine/threonine protein kinase